MISLLTAVEIQSSPKEDFVICARQDINTRWAAFIYRLKEGHFHKLLLSSDPVFSSENEAVNTMTRMFNRILTLDLTNAQPNKQASVSPID